MSKLVKKVSCLAVTFCMIFLGVLLVKAENVSSWSVTIPKGSSISQSVNCSYSYQRAGNYRTSDSSSTMTMNIKKNGGTISTSTLPTQKRSWVWSGWASQGSGTRVFEYKTVSGSTFVGSVQATDSSYSY